MNYRYFYCEEHDMVDWIAKEYFGIELIPDDSNNDKTLLYAINDAYIQGDIEEVYKCGRLLYFDNAAARTAFMLRWGT